MEYKSAPARVQVKDEAKGIVQAVVGVFGNLDDGGDITEQGAFAASLTEASHPPYFVADHEWKIQTLLGKTLSAEETDEGLVMTGQLNLDKQIARDAYSDFKFGSIREFSFGYDVAPGGSYVDDDGNRHLTKVNLFEWSPVVVGMNRATRLVGVKGGEQLALSEAVEWLERAAAEHKAGRRNANADADRLQKIHDLVNELGVVCPQLEAADAPKGWTWTQLPVSSATATTNGVTHTFVNPTVAVVAPAPPAAKQTDDELAVAKARLALQRAYQ